MLLLSFFAASQSITDESFLGEWCGKWDDSYALCISIDSVEESAFAKYKWVEQTGGGFSKTRKEIRRLNLNTLQLENIIFVLDERDLNKVDAIGIFRMRTRMAVLTKTKLESELE